MTAHFTPSEITLKESPGSTFKELVGAALEFVDSDGLQWIAPVGTLTDGASVPRLALGVTDGRFENMFLKAAVVHDAYCQDINKDRSPGFQSRPWQQVHRMFYDACLAGGTPKLRASLMYSAVYWFGPRWADPGAEQQQVATDVARIGFAASKQWIEAEEPDIPEIESDAQQRERQIARISGLQYQAIAAMNASDWKRVDANLKAADELIARGLERRPDDLMYLNLYGYQRKNWAMLRPEVREQKLDEAETVFTKVLTIEPRDPSALNGLGSVAALHGEFDKAEEFVVKALREDPDYAAAWHDLRLIYKLRDMT